MALPPLANVPALGAWVGEDIPADDARAEAVLSAASTLVRSYTGQTWVDEDGDLQDVPDAAAAVTVQVAARLWRNPNGFLTERVDDYSYQLPERVADGLYLTQAEKDMLADLVVTAKSKIRALTFERGDLRRLCDLPSASPLYVNADGQVVEVDP